MTGAMGVPASERWAGRTDCSGIASPRKDTTIHMTTSTDNTLSSTSGAVDQLCPVCENCPAEPVFFEGRMVCLKHLAPCDTCVGGWRLRGEPACGPCAAVIKPTTVKEAA
jgi:hypothetical protein